jgi:drug/metabolite transporter (DMT)-like permease
LFFLSIIIYRGLYLAGLKFAPIVEGNLLNYLFPLLIILFGSIGKRVRPSSKILVGAIFCFTGVICIGLGKTGGTLSFEAGHIFAILGAMTWALYSVLTDRFPPDSTDMVGIMHIVAVILFFGLHLIFEPSISLTELPLLSWIGICGWGLGVSYGYSLWDTAMKHGNSENVSIAAYSLPLLSTLWLILFAGQRLTVWTWLAALLILSGLLIAKFTWRLFVGLVVRAVNTFQC